METKKRGSLDNTRVSSLKLPWEPAKADLMKIKQQKEEIQAKLDAVNADKQLQQQSNGSTTKEEVSVMDKAKAAGTEGKRRAKLQLLERELRTRKQQASQNGQRFEKNS